MNSPKGFFIGGKLHNPTSELKEIKNPFNGEVVAVICLAGQAEREKTVRLACDSFERVSNLLVSQRISVLEGLHDGIRSRNEEIAKTIALEAGKPVKLARGEVLRGLNTISISIDAAGNPDVEHISFDTGLKSSGRYGIVQRFPIGPVLGITPFNFPLNLVLHKLAPALACGCPFILKPSTQTASTALILGEILNELGTEPGQVSIVPMSASTADGFVGDDRIKLITFTGSDTVGWSIKARSHKTRVALELGGNAGCIVEPDANLEWAVDRCVMGAFSFQGQVCISLQRLFIHEDIYDNFIAKFIEKTKQLVMGDPLDEKTDLGPMITEQEAIRVKDWIDEASDKDAKILTGGNRKGSMLEPTIIENPSDECRVVSDEVFGPVVRVKRYSNFDDAVQSVGKTRYGLQAGIFTNDMEKACKAFKSWQVGGVIVNDVPTFRSDEMPYGGSRDSGIGREGPKYAIEEMTERRIMVVNKL
jgi:acyl-CoA reductase-like NAD-dependent aldehyde dehydrogenase